MSLPKFTYLAPDSLEEACQLLANHQGTIKIKAGGTDLMVRLAQHALKPAYLMALGKIPGLAEVSYTPTAGLKLGAMALLAEVVNNPAIQEHYPMLARAANATATVQIRNMGTVMGNVCNASPSADNIPSLMVHGASIKTISANGEREIPLSEFFLGPGRTALESGEIATAILVPPLPASSGVSYQKISRRSKVDIAAVNVAAMLQLDADGTCQQARICLGAVGPTPLQATKTAAFLQGKALHSETIEEAGELAAGEASPISDVRASKEYRKLMVAVLTKRALSEACHLATGTKS
ncbi:MAG: xanthine dehydrogenase family protein subunit M [Deltaproteobacteria bacterium]|nr:xanthine dehydrogenase family protein subunit M [Candidatus Anaeroferrophillus wilburensis]MBN2888688.1 xanthine dehydrogenase family protein subunit M [Deltaproteobacteria bacterium]